MNTDRLSLRLEVVAKYIPKGAKFADIGSDHAYLPCYMLKKERANFAIAGEVVDGPYQSAIQQVKQEGLIDVISVRKGNGLEVVSEGEVDCITIAGMGGTLIASILENGKDKLASVKRLVLQPNISAYSIRRWLQHNNWYIVEEEIIEEDGKIYEVLVAEQLGEGEQIKLDELSLLMGPLLIKEKNEAFRKKWLHEKKNWQRILQQLVGAPDSEDNKKRQLELHEKIQMVEKVMKNEKH